MLDINKETLKYLKANLSEITFSLTNRENILQIVLNSKESPWDLNIDFQIYKDITFEILTNFDISKVILELEFANDYYNKEEIANISIFYSIIIRYLYFLKSVYEVYLLDQLLYLLTNCPLDYDFKPLKTKSYYEEINFGFTFNQMSLTNHQDEYKIFEHDLFNLKSWYKMSIKKILQSNSEKSHLFKELSSKVAFEDNPNDYYKVNLLSLYEALKEQVEKTKKAPLRDRKKRSVIDSNQVAFY